MALPKPISIPRELTIIFDNVEDDLRDGKYYRAFKTYITLSAAYMEDDSELNFDHDYIYDKPQDDFDPNNEYATTNMIMTSTTQRGT